MIIAICGATAAGKTTFTNKILDFVDQRYVASLQHDSYYRNQDELPAELRGKNNFDHPEALDNSLFASHLELLRCGKPIDAPIYDFGPHRRRPETRSVEPKPVILVEGMLLLAVPEVRRLLDIKVFIDTADDLRFLRRLRRDVTERNRSHESVIAQYLDTVRPFHSQFVEPSKRHADVIVPGDADNPVAVGLVVSRINETIAEWLRREKASS